MPSKKSITEKVKTPRRLRKKGKSQKTSGTVESERWRDALKNHQGEDGLDFRRGRIWA
ncbi:MAG: hypothetical protein F6K58_04155 [Symploca sp. SIO2E9]|nr:hypothetical protein [Symploca sp. SIO2E9]